MKVILKNLSLLIEVKLASALALMLMAGNSAYAASLCSSGYDANSANGASCAFSPGELKLDFYQIGLCTSEPTDYADAFSKCTFFLDNTEGGTNVSPAATVVSAVNGEEFPVPGTVEIETGTYTHAVLMFNSTISFKGVASGFGSNQVGADGVRGTFCYTNGNSALDYPAYAYNRNISCAASSASANANALFSTMHIQSFGAGDDNYCNNQTTLSLSSQNIIDFFGVPGIPAFNAVLFDSLTYDGSSPASTLSELLGLDRCYSNGDYGDFHKVQDGDVTATWVTHDTRYLWVVQDIDDVTFDPTSTSLSIAFGTTNALGVNSYFDIPGSAVGSSSGKWCNFSGPLDAGNSCLGDVKLQAFVLKASSN